MWRTAKLPRKSQTFCRQVIVKKKREVKPSPVVTVKDGPTGDVAYGSNLRLTLIVRAAPPIACLRHSTCPEATCAATLV